MCQDNCNVNMVCEAHAPRSGNYKDMKPEFFVGRLIKLGFKAINPATGKQTLEHMWVATTALAPKSDDSKELIGVLTNEPILDCGVEYGSKVEFNVEEIEMILPEGNG